MKFMAIYFLLFIQPCLVACYFEINIDYTTINVFNFILFLFLALVGVGMYQVLKLVIRWAIARSQSTGDHVSLPNENNTEAQLVDQCEKVKEAIE